MRAVANGPQALLAHANEIQGSLSLTGPLMRAVHYRLPERNNRLLLVLHHLVVDAFSWRVLLADLETAYAQVVSGRPIRLPEHSVSYGDWARALASYAESDELRDELTLWQAQEEIINKFFNRG